MRKRAIFMLLVAALAWVAWHKGPTKVSTAATNDTLRDRLVVHEWGTFTSYSGSDGVRLEFRPLVDNDLPPFVLDRMSLSGLNVFTKTRIRARVRMETPVTYFYTDKPRDVRVRVGFPQGLLTEFYPPVEKYAPHIDFKKGDELANSMLDWGTVTLIPTQLLRPQIADEKLARTIEQRAVNGLVPATGDNPYQFARETDAALVHVQRPVNEKHPWAPSGDFFEKFLFYRGLGNFALPLQAQALGDGRFQVVNRSTENISWGLAFEVVGEQVRFTTFDGVQKGMMREVSLPAAAGDQQQMINQLVAALVDEGLYQREAVAMVNTWKASWFGEQGTRVLYMVPQHITDEMLPLEIEPRPDEMVRVLVGRLDIMSPEDEAIATELVRRSAEARARAAADAKAKEIALVYPVPREILDLGRLAEPALARVRDLARDDQIFNEATWLLAELAAAREVEEKPVNWTDAIAPLIEE